jgi:hypothetical protein
MAIEADIDQRHPGQRGRHEQQRCGDQLGAARSRSRRLDRAVAVVIVRVIVMAMIIVSRRSMGVGVTMVTVMLDLVA